MKTITVLPYDEVKYIKTISFDMDFCGRYYTAKVVYKRNLSANYPMDSTKRSKVDEIMCYFPEECYPKDAIDELILKSVLERFPSAKVHTKLMLCDCERDEIMRELSHYPQVSFQINIQPRIDDIQTIINMHKAGKIEWRVFIKSLPLYLTNSNESELFSNSGSIIYYDLDKENDMIQLEPTLLNEVTTF